jgi:uncharacterized protein (TIGR02145 family)
MEDRMNSYFKLVLLTAIFVATTFTFSCSGDDGATGPQGEQGDKGGKGDKGEPGAPCTLLGNIITCGDKSFTIPTDGLPGTPGASCTVGDDDNGIKLVCGDNAVVIPVFCGNTAFNPLVKLCDVRDGQVYRYVKIGTQTWMAENMNYKGSSFGDCYADQETNCEKYGSLYQFARAGSSVCPAGWSLPSKDDWEALIKYADPDYDNTASPNGSNVAGKKLKAKVGWATTPTNLNGTDDFGFSALPGGIMGSRGETDDLGDIGWFWSSDENTSSGIAYVVAIRSLYNNTERDIQLLTKTRGERLSVRCIKD